MQRTLWWSLLVTIAQYACGYVAPAYFTFQAIESKENLDDTQWLTYWLLFAVFTTLEGVIWPVLKYIPLYQEIKLVLLAWLSLPQLKGANAVYVKARPYILKALSFIDSKTPLAANDTKGVLPSQIRRERISCVVNACVIAWTREPLTFYHIFLRWRCFLLVNDFSVSGLIRI